MKKKQEDQNHNEKKKTRIIILEKLNFLFFLKQSVEWSKETEKQKQKKQKNEKFQKPVLEGKKREKIPGWK